MGRSRGPGGGRKRAEEHDPGLPAALDKLVEPDSRGDPMTPLRWTSKSLRHLADQLRAQGHQASPTLVGRLLREADYSLQANSKTVEGNQHPDRDAWFQDIHDTRRARYPSVDDRRARHAEGPKEPTVPMPNRRPVSPPPGARLIDDLAGLDYALPGSLARRYMRCGKANCRCKTDPPILHGPYLHWTRTVAGKTVTRTLTEDQTHRYQAWFDNARRLHDAVTELEAQSLRAVEETEGRQAGKS